MNRIGRDEILLTLGWDNSPIWAARLGLSDNVRASLRWLTTKTQIYGNGIGYDGNCKYEFSGNMITSFNECLLQSYDGIIRVFPAVSQAEKGGEARFKLHASGGFIVESEFNFARLQANFVKIHSLRGNLCRIYNPYGAGRKALLRCGEMEFFFTNELIEFDTEAGKDYYLTLAKEPKFEAQDPESYCNRKAKKLNAFGFSRIIGKQRRC